MVTQIEEMEFETHPMDNEYWDHCVHLLHLKNGEKYVLDLTGVQFGPDWPLLQKEEEYCKRAAEIKPPSRLGATQALRLSMWHDDDIELRESGAWVRLPLVDKLKSVSSFEEPSEEETLQNGRIRVFQRSSQWSEAASGATRWYQNNFPQLLLSKRTKDDKRI